jgi:hypothetical protein
MKILPVALAVALVGCAAAPPCKRKAAPPVPAGPAAEWKDCVLEGNLEKGRPAVVRYAAGTADSVRTPERTISGPRTQLCWPGPIAIGPRGEVYVLNRTGQWWGKNPSSRPGWDTWVTVYDSAARGDAAPTRMLGIPTTGNNSGISLAVDRAGYLYIGSERVAWEDSGSVAVFDKGADGDVEPLRVLAGHNTGLRWPAALTVDRHGNLYAVNYERSRDDTVRVWGPDAEGNLEPCRVIAGERTGLARPVGLAVDRKDRLYVASAGHRRPGGVSVFDAWADGDASPSRTFSAPEISDGMRQPERLAIGRGDSLYVRSARNLSVFAAEPDDTTRPSRTFFSGAPRRFVLDRHDTLYALDGSAVVVYPPGYSGGRAEVRRFTTRGMDLRDVDDMALDSRGWLYLASDSAIRIFAPGASGDAAPSRTIAGSRTRLREVRGIALDRSDRLYVANGPRRGGGGIAIRVYAPGAKEEEQPVRELAGTNPGLQRAGVMAFDAAGDMYISDAEGPDPGIVKVFRRGADGDVAPERVLMGPETLLRNPNGLALGRGDTLYVLNVFGTLGSRRCGPYAASNATVTVYPPRASGDLEPVRSIVLVKNGKAPAGANALLLPRGIDVDTTGTVRVWHAGGSVMYAPGAGGFVPPVATVTETREDGVEARGVSVSSDGAIYQTNVPKQALTFC